jgi:hypothetical protein
VIVYTLTKTLYGGGLDIVGVFSTKEAAKSHYPDITWMPEHSSKYTFADGVNKYDQKFAVDSWELQ